MHILENIQDPEHKGLHLVYSQFRTLEGIGILKLILESNGFEQFKIKKLNSSFCDEFNIDFQSYYDIKIHEIDNGVFNDHNLIKRLNITLSKKSKNCCKV